MHPITIVFALLMLATVVVGVIYLARRTAWVLACKARGLYIAYGILLGYSFLMMSLCKYGFGGGFLLNRLIVTGASLCGIFICLFLCLAVVETVNRIHYLGRKTFGSAVVLSTFALCAYGFINAAHPRVKQVEIELRQLERPLTVVHLTDLHLGHFRGKRFVDKIAARTKALKPDIVVITGDLFESRYNLADSTISALGRLEVPVYFVIGNHDLYVDGDEVRRFVSRQGIRLLNNELTEYGPLYIGGIDFLPADSTHSNHMRLPEDGPTVESVMPGLQAPDDRPYLLLAHHACGVEYIEAAGADLLLAGHTHGGQFFPLTVVNHFVFPYNRGLHRFENLQIYTSDGLGTTGFPMRTGTTSELTCIKLVPTAAKTKK